jgi:hypothetical protein
MNTTPSAESSPLKNEVESERLKLEVKRLAFERTKLAIETRQQRRGERARGTKSLKESLSNPLVLAIAGGSLTLITSIVTNYLTATGNREADERRATYTRDAESRSLQSELIKAFLRTQDSKTARDNLTFLIESGLIPDHEKRITEYLAKNTKTIPKITDTAPVPTTLPPRPALKVGPRNNDEVLGVSLHLGTNRLDPSAYGGWDGELRGAVPDANSMQQLAASLGYNTNILIDALARSDYFLSALDTISATLRAGDTLFLTMSGHGGQKPDVTAAEPDKLEDSWVLFDREVPAMEVYERFTRFKAGVTIIVVQDASHPCVFRHPPKMPDLSAHLIVFAGAKEDQLAMDGERQGKFTECLLQTWNEGKFSGNYTTFLETVVKKMPKQQIPQLYIYSADKSVGMRKPFALASGR